MEIGRKIFFDILTGNIIFDTGEREGSAVETTAEHDIATFSTLSERNRETFGVLELPFGAYASDFSEGRLIGVDLVTNEPIFSYPNPNEPIEPIIEQIPMSTQIESLEATFMYDSMMKDMAIEESNNQQADLMYQLMMNGVL